MSVLRLLIVEDDEQDLSTCRDTVERYENEKQRKSRTVECKYVRRLSSALTTSSTVRY